MELLIPDGIITLPYLAGPPLPSKNDMHSSLVLPELNIKINTNSLLPIDKEANMIALFLSQTKKSTSKIMTIPSLLNEVDPDN